MDLLCGGVSDSAETACGGTGGYMSWCGGNMRGGGASSASSASCFGGDLGRASRTAFNPPSPGDLRIERFSGVSDSPERRRGRACLRRGCGLAGLTGGDAAGGSTGALHGVADRASSRSWSANPRTWSDSPALITDPSCSCATETSPRYIKSTTACTSHP